MGSSSFSFGYDLQREMCRKVIYPTFVKSLRDGDMERAASQAIMLNDANSAWQSQKFWTDDADAEDAIREAELILEDARSGYRPNPMDYGPCDIDDETLDSIEWDD